MAKIIRVYIDFVLIILTLTFSSFLFSSLAHAQDNQSAQETIQTPTTFIIAPPPQFELAEPRSFHYGENESLVHIEGALIAPLRLNQPAPFAGVILNAQANAWIIAEFQAIQEYWINEMNHRVDEMRVWAFAEIAGYQSRLTEEQNAIRVQLDQCAAERIALEHATQELQRQYRKERRRIRVRNTFTIIGSVIGAGLGGFFIGRAIP